MAIDDRKRIFNERRDCDVAALFMQATDVTSTLIRYFHDSFVFFDGIYYPDTGSSVFLGNFLSMTLMCLSN